MATKIIKAWIDGAVQEIEVEDTISSEQPLSVEERVETLESKHDVVITDGNFLVGNGTKDLKEMTPSEVLEHINGASVMTMTTEEFEALSEEENNANTLYMLTDSDDRPDWNQNDETAANFIKNRTHYDNTVTNDYTFTFDGTLESKEYYDFNGYGSLYYVKVSDETPSVEEIVGATITISDFGNIGQYEVFEDMITTEELTADFVGYEIRALYGRAYVAVVLEDTTEMTKGTWFLYYNEEMRIIYPTELSYSITTGELKQLEPKYIKDMYYDSRRAGEINITFDGNLNGKEYVEYTPAGEGALLVKVSDSVPQAEEIIGGTLYFLPSGMTSAIPNTIKPENLNYISDTLYQFGGFATFALEDAEIEGGFFFSKGTWLLWDDNNGSYVSGISYTGTVGELKQIDTKYIPTATDDEIIEMLAQEDMLPVVTDSDGALLSDENNNVLLW